MIDEIEWIVVVHQYPVSPGKISQAIDCVAIFVLFFGRRFMLRSTCCFLHAMESLLVLREWGGDADITSPFFFRAAISLS